MHAVILIDFWESITRCPFSVSVGLSFFPPTDLLKSRGTKATLYFSLHTRPRKMSVRNQETQRHLRVWSLSKLMKDCENVWKEKRVVLPLNNWDTTTTRKASNSHDSLYRRRIVILKAQSTKWAWQAKQEPIFQRLCIPLNGSRADVRLANGWNYRA